MKIALCDDSSDDRALIRDILEQYEKKEDISFLFYEYDSGKKLLDAIKNGTHPDIVLLDINMDQMDGLQTAKGIRQKLPDVMIIIVTAYLSFALDGYKVKANRFLVKDDLLITLPDCMDDIISELSKKRWELTFEFFEGVKRLKLDDILYIESLGHTALYHYGSEIFRQNKRLSDIEADLNPYDFIRVHKSYIVNLKYIERVKNYSLTMQDGEEISVPRSRYAEVKSAYAAYRGGHVL